MKIIDLTHKITETMPVYPGTEPPHLSIANTYEKDGFRETLLTMFSHTGTHVDPPSHLFPDRTSLDSLPVSQFAGKALVIDCTNLQEGEAITMQQLLPYGSLTDKADFLLFNLGWDKRWGRPDYFNNYPCIDEAVLNFILNSEKKGIGFDVIGVDPIGDAELPRHKKLFAEHDIINIENLTNLDQCGSELFWFFALPLHYENADGAPIRAIAFWEDKIQ